MDGSRRSRPLQVVLASAQADAAERRVIRNRGFLTRQEFAFRNIGQSRRRIFLLRAPWMCPIFRTFAKKTMEDDVGALHKIKIALRDGATSLDLSGMGLTERPPEIVQLTELEALFLCGNLLSVRPPAWSRLRVYT